MTNKPFTENQVKSLKIGFYNTTINNSYIMGIPNTNHNDYKGTFVISNKESKDMLKSISLKTITNHKNVFGEYTTLWSIKENNSPLRYGKAILLAL